MPSEYQSLNDLINLIDEPNRDPSHKVLNDNIELFSSTRGSSHNHQAWDGGYLDHLTEIMNIAVLLYEPLNNSRKLPFSLSDALLVLYLHDLEKPWRFEKIDGEWQDVQELSDKETQVWPFVKQKIKEYGFNLTEDHWTGLKYVEGEKSSYSPTRRSQNPLSAFAHMCDTWSARGWYNHPKRKNDSWIGAKRSK